MLAHFSLLNNTLVNLAMYSRFLREKFTCDEEISNSLIAFQFFCF